jgi:hypothetical protein
LSAFRAGWLVACAFVVGFTPIGAQAKCSRRVGDALIAGPQGRFQCAKPKSMISYLHNNLVTPYSYSCAEKLRSTCKTEGCENPANAEEELRCQGRYVAVLNSCVKELDGAAIMAKCKDTQTWALRPIDAAEASGTRVASVTHAKPAAVAAAPSPVSVATAEPLAAAAPVVAASPLSTAPLVPSVPVNPAFTAVSPPAGTAPLEFYGPPSAAAPTPPPAAKPSNTPPSATAGTPSGSVEIVSGRSANRALSQKIRVRRVRPRALRPSHTGNS